MAFQLAQHMLAEYDQAEAELVAQRLGEQTRGLCPESAQLAAGQFPHQFVGHLPA